MSSQSPSGYGDQQETGGQASPKDDNSPRAIIMRFVSKNLQSRKQIRLAAVIGISIAVIVIIVLTVAIYFSTASSDDSASPSQISGSQANQGWGNKGIPGSPTPSTYSSASDYNITSTQKVTTSRNFNQSTIASPNPTTSGETSFPPTLPNVRMNDVVLHMDNKSLALSCSARHLGSWKTLTIKRIFGDALEPVVIAVNENNKPTVHVLHYNASHEITLTTDSIALSITINSFSCNDVSNYSCVLDTGAALESTDASVSLYLPDSLSISVPHVIVEDREVMLHCSVDTIGSGASIQWQVRTAGMDTFMNFGNEPVVERIDRNCTTTISSNLTFSPSMYENGSDFRCLLEGIPQHVRQPRHVDTQILVVQKDFCEGKREFTVHPHPYNTCTLVIYCLDSGPLVYEIVCEPGQCFDTTKTTCVPDDDP